jgi:dihydrofolate reductase
VLNNTPKYVASTTLKDPLPWMNSVLLKGDLSEALVTLKQASSKDIVILGSGVLIQSLMSQGLIDQFMLLLHPLVLGSGKHLFADDGTLAKLHLIDTKPTSSGVVISTYEFMRN